MVFKGAIYILEYNKVMRIESLNGNFSKPKVQEIILKREYSDMAIANSTFLFVRGFSTLISSPTFNPEDPNAIELKSGFSHGAFKYAGFDHYVLRLTETESSDHEYYYFYRLQTDDQSEPKSVKVGRLSGNATSLKFKRMV